MTKTYWVYRCPVCKRRRRIYETGERYEEYPAGRAIRRFRWLRCSQGHRWSVEIGSLERISEIARATIVPAMQQAFLQPNPFLTYLKR